LRSGESAAAVDALVRLGRVATVTTADTDLKRGLLKVALQDAFECHDQAAAAEALHQFAVHDSDDDNDSGGGGGSGVVYVYPHFRVTVDAMNCLREHACCELITTGTSRQLLRFFHILQHHLLE